MNGKVKKSSIVFALGLLIVVIASTTPQGREYIESISSSIGASAVADGRYEITITLNYDRGGAFEWRSPISRREYKEAEIFKEDLIKKYGVKARKALARKMGYFNNLYGEDNDKMTSARLTQLTVSDLRIDKDHDLVLRR